MKTSVCVWQCVIICYVLGWTGWEDHGLPSADTYLFIHALIVLFASLCRPISLPLPYSLTNSLTHSLTHSLTLFLILLFVLLIFSLSLSLIATLSLSLTQNLFFFSLITCSHVIGGWRWSSTKRRVDDRITPRNPIHRYVGQEHGYPQYPW